MSRRRHTIATRRFRTIVYYPYVLCLAENTTSKPDSTRQNIVAGTAPTGVDNVIRIRQGKH